MEFKTIELYGASYDITDTGRVFSHSTGQELSQRLDHCGYSCFTGGDTYHRRRIRTHIIVAKLFVPNPNNYPEVDHIDNNRANASADNLEWVTRQENIRRVHERGTYYNGFKGTKNPKAKLNEEKVKYIRELYNNGMTQMEISKKLNIPWSTIHNIVTFQTWKDI